MKTLLTTLVLFNLLNGVFSQNNIGEISGTIQQASGEVVPFANILLLNAKDSSLVKGTISKENGDFLFEKTKFGTYLVMASMVGYQKTYSSVFTLSAENTAVKLRTLKIEPNTNQLKEVTVSVKRPFIEQAIDRTIVNVANSIVGSGSTALEVLEKSPGITVDYQAESLQMRGKDGVLLQIDGKISYLSQQDMVALLRSMPSDNIEKIELITNPSARYDAAGNSGIINIRLKKNNNIGTNGALSVAAGSGFYARQRSSLQLTHRTPKVNLFGNYGVANSGNFTNFKLTTDNLPNPTATNTSRRNFIDLYAPNKAHVQSQNGKIGVDYPLSKNTNLGVVWTGNWLKNDESVAITTDFSRTENATPYSATLTDRIIKKPFQNHTGNLNFQHNFGDKKGQLSADADLFYFKRDYSNSLQTRTTLSSDNPYPSPFGLLNTMPTQIDIWTIKADYNRPLKNGWTLETGIKTAQVETDNDLKIKTGTNGSVAIDTALSNHFTYSERVNTAYLSFAGKINPKTDMQMGLRAEHTQSIGNSLTLKLETPRQYLNLFPSLFVSRQLDKKQTLTFAYSYRIDRPNYQAVNPGREYVDPYTYRLGEPALKPQYTHALELKYGFENKAYLSVAADFIHDFMQSINYILSETTTIRRWQNSGAVQGYTLTGSFPLTVVKGWQLQTNFLGYYKRFNFTYEDQVLQYVNLSARLNVSNGFVFGKGWTGELNGWINTPRRLNIISTAPWLGTVDVGLQKSISSVFKVKLSVQDVFYTNRYIETVHYPNGSLQTGHITFDSRIAMLTLNYNFGNQQLKMIRQRRAASEEEAKRAN